MNPKQELMLFAMKGSLGVVSSAAKKAGIHPQTHYNWIYKDSEYKKAVEGLKEYVIDWVESKLYEVIRDKKDTKAIIFWLKNKGRKRGYRERDINLETTNINVQINQINIIKDAMLEVLKPYPDALEAVHSKWLELEKNEMEREDKTTNIESTQGSEPDDNEICKDAVEHNIIPETKRDA